MAEVNSQIFALPIERIGVRVDQSALEDAILLPQQDVGISGEATHDESCMAADGGSRRTGYGFDCRKALEPPGQARDDTRILTDLAARLGQEWHYESAEVIWDELRSLAPNHAGMSYRRLEELGGIQWPCYSEDKLEPTFLHGRLWEEPGRGRPRCST